MMKNLFATALSLGLLSVTAGCGPTWVEHDVVVSEAPPAPRAEAQPEPPMVDGYVWSPGHWVWSGREWVWMRGRWVVAPAAGLVYVRPGWVVYGSSYRWVPGRWARPSYAPSYRYVHPAPRYHRVPRRR